MTAFDTRKSWCLLLIVYLSLVGTETDAPQYAYLVIAVSRRPFVKTIEPYAQSHRLRFFGGNPKQLGLPVGLNTGYFTAGEPVLAQVS